MSCHTQVILRAILVALLVGTMMYSEAQGAQAKFYVATDGNDAWTGRLPAPDAAGTDGPFATLTRARDAIREVKATAGLHQPVKVLVRGGTYHLSETLMLRSQDSGTASFPITYMAYAGEQPVLSGGRLITGWKPYQGKIWHCDLNALGLEKLSFKQLFYNGERQPLARFPNVDPQRPRTGGFLYIAEGGMKGSKKLLKYDPSKLDPSRWANPTIVEANICPYHNWENFIVPIAEIDLANHVITLAHEVWHELINDTRFYIRNAFEELDAPGEWYRDSKTSTLYFWPPDDNLAAGQVVVPALDTIIHIRGGDNDPVRYLRIGEFTLQMSQGGRGSTNAVGPEAAVRLEAAQQSTVAKCTITNIGCTGIFLDSACRENRLVGNDIAHIGVTGIRVEGEDNLISNNHVYDTGVIVKRYSAMRIGGRGNLVAHNLIHDVPAIGINFRGRHSFDNIIEYNEIHHFGMETNVAGGMYAYALKESAVVGGVIIRFNKVSDAVGYGMPSPGEWGPNPGWGLWLDDMISNTTMYGNILVRNLRAGIVIHGGTDNVVENNIMGAGIPSTSNHIRPGEELCNNKILRNIVYYANADPTLLKQYGWTVKGITETDASAAAIPVFLCGWSSVKAAVSESDYNLLFPIRGEAVRALLNFRGVGEAFFGPWADEPVPDRFAWWRSQGYDAHSIIADPLFADITHDDYTLAPESPAFKLDFKPIPQERIGLYPSPNRASWPIPEHMHIWREETAHIVPVKPAPPKAEALRPKLKAARGIAGIVVDGDVGEWPWDDATRIVVLQESPSGELTTAPKSYACAAYDDEALYIAIRNLVGDPKALKTDGGWGQQDGVEIAFQDISGEKPGPVLNLYGYPDGQFEAGAIPPGLPTEATRKLARAATYAAQIGSDYWSCEWQIPWAATGIDPSKVKRLWFNVGVRKTAADAWVMWEGGGAICTVKDAGDLILLP